VGLFRMVALSTRRCGSAFPLGRDTLIYPKIVSDFHKY
jgi:hypothetical protein